MHEVSSNAWEVDCDVLCITTNGTVTQSGSNIMGGGIAREAAVMNYTLPVRYGELIRRFGHHVYLFPSGGSVPLLMFPTKDRIDTPATLQRIVKSIQETKILADLYGWKTIGLPRPGAGLGGLDWHTEVKPGIKSWLDDRFVIISFPGEA